MDLLAFERKLDATIMRKRLEIQEAIRRPMKQKRKLRVFISHTFSATETEVGVREVGGREVGVKEVGGREVGGREEWGHGGGWEGGVESLSIPGCFLRLSDLSACGTVGK